MFMCKGFSCDLIAVTGRPVTSSAVQNPFFHLQDKCFEKHSKFPKNKAVFFLGKPVRNQLNAVCST